MIKGSTAFHRGRTAPSDAPLAAAGRPHILFLGTVYAGHETRFMNLREHAQGESRATTTFHSVRGWKQDGFFERLPVPRGVRGRLRALQEASRFAAFPRPDAIWTSATEILTPLLWSQLGPLRRPLVLDIDCTAEQLEEMAPYYFDRGPKRGLRKAQSRAQERLLFRFADIVTPWSNWAADGLRAGGFPDSRIRVLPPGIDLERWAPVARAPRPPERPLRLLFVGGDFARKGGDLVVDAVLGPLRGRAELDIVTRDDVPEAPGVRVHRATPNSPELRALYANADLFVLPTRAECFGIATVEAMASGLPVIMGDVGGARDIVQDGRTGWLIPPDAEALRDRLERAFRQPARLAAMGARARKVACERFDGARNDAAIVELMLELATSRKQRG
ncbi:MAG: glycosyltransferase family 4 protein [Hyphomicrobiales bacterium]